MPGITDSLNDLFIGAGSVVGKAKDALTDSLGLPTGAPSNIWKTGNILLPEYACLITCSELGIYFKAAMPPEFDWSVEVGYDTPIKDVINGAISNLGTVGKAGSTLARAQGLSLVTQALTSKFWTGSSTGDISIPLVLQAETSEVDQVMKPLLSLLSLSMPKLAGGKRGSILEAPGPHFDIAKAFNAAKNGVTSSGTTSVAGATVNSNSLSGALGQGFGALTTAAGSAIKPLLSGDISGSLSSVQSSVESAAGYLDSLAKQGVRNQITLQLGNYIRLPSVVITNVGQKHYMQPVGKEYGVSSGNIQRIEIQLSFQPFMDLTQDDLPDIFLDPAVSQLAKDMLYRRDQTAGTAGHTGRGDL